LSANLGVAFGIYNYRKNDYHRSDFPLEWLNAAVSISILLLAEISFQMRMRNELEFLIN
jgi:hypothetical protein